MLDSAKPVPDTLGSVPSLTAIFFTFFRTTIVGFGGVLPWARRMLVEKRSWMTPAQFNEVWSLCQVLPGPNMINLGLIVGRRFQGVLGSLAAVLGLLGAPMLIVMAVGSLYVRFAALPEVHGALRGIAAVAAGMIVATAVKMALPLFQRRARIGLVFAAMALAGVSLLGIPLPLVFLAIAPLSIAVEWRRH